MSEKTTNKSHKKRNQYKELLYKIQQPKMQELWDNKHDEVWGKISFFLKNLQKTKQLQKKR